LIATKRVSWYLYKMLFSQRHQTLLIMDCKFLVFHYATSLFIRPSRDGPYYVIGYGGRAGVHTGFRTITLVLYIRFYQTWPHDSPVEGESCGQVW
jgi:hypothetical protein